MQEPPFKTGQKLIEKRKVIEKKAKVFSDAANHIRKDVMANIPSITNGMNLGIFVEENDVNYAKFVTIVLLEELERAKIIKGSFYNEFQYKMTQLMNIRADALDKKAESVLEGIDTSQKEAREEIIQEVIGGVGSKKAELLRIEYEKALG